MFIVFEVQVFSSLELKCLLVSVVSVQLELEVVEGIIEVVMGCGIIFYELVEVIVIVLKENYNFFFFVE